MDINIKNVPEADAKRLAEQAEAEGLSQQEWIRQVLHNTANRMSPAEFARIKPSAPAISEADYMTFIKDVAARRRKVIEKLGASNRRR